MDNLQKRNLALAAFFGFPAMFGITDLILFRHEFLLSVSTYIHALLGVMSILMCVIYDAKAREYRLHLTTGFLIVCFAIAGVAAYLFYSRGWKGALKLGLGIPAFVIFWATYQAAWYVSYWIGDAIGYF